MIYCPNCQQPVSYCRGCEIECPFCGEDLRLSPQHPPLDADKTQENCDEHLGPDDHCLESFQKECNDLILIDDSGWPFPWLKGKLYKRDS